MKLYTLHMHTHQKQIEYPCLFSLPLGKEDYGYLFLTHLAFFSKIQLEHLETTSQLSDSHFW